ncbi:MAG: antibiotic biosynthesis monooxygenase [Sphingomonadaceae bacterium]
MRVIVAGTLQFDGDICADIIRDGREYILASRAEIGCVAYNWSADPLEPGLMHVFEEWTSEAALGAHFRDASYQAMRAHLGQYPMTGFAVQLYRASEVEPVYTDDGQPRDRIFGVWIGPEA